MSIAERLLAAPAPWSPASGPHVLPAGPWHPGTPVPTVSVCFSELPACPSQGHASVLGLPSCTGPGLPGGLPCPHPPLKLGGWCGGDWPSALSCPAALRTPSLSVCGIGLALSSGTGPVCPTASTASALVTRGHGVQQQRGTATCCPPHGGSTARGETQSCAACRPVLNPRATQSDSVALSIFTSAASITTI